MSDGEMTIGWQKIDGVYYFFNGQGQMQAGKWLHLKDSREKIDGNWYYLNNNGDMRETGWFNQDGNWYYITSTGARSYNELLEIAGQKYLFDKDGKMLTGYQVYNGKKMFFADSGALQTAGKPSTWQKISSDWYFYDEDGLRTVGKKNINGATYYFNQEGVMQTGWAFIDGHWNYFANSGAMQTGWHWLDKHWHYYADSGTMKTGWLKEQGTWYYLENQEGIMLVGFQQVDGKQYYFSASGAMQTGWKRIDGNWYYFQTDGSLLKNTTMPDGYKVNEEGIWKISQTTVAVEQDKKEQITETSTSTENPSTVENNSSHHMIGE